MSIYERWEVDGSRAMTVSAPEHDRKFVIALARGLDVLRAFTPTDYLLGNQEIATRTGLPKATVSRLTYTLTKLGYLKHIERLSKYTLAPSALSIGYSALVNMRIRQVALPFMRELADYTGAAVALGIRDRLNLIYIEQARGRTAVMLRLDLGARIPIATTSMGRAMIAALPEDERRWLLDHLEKHSGDEWPKLREGVEESVQYYKEHGFTLSVGDWQRDISAVGVPYVPVDGSGVFAFNCGAPQFKLSRDQLENDIGPRLIEMVRKVDAAFVGAH